MAEIALGGINIVVGTRRSRQAAECRHTETMSTTTAGLERIVCEACGHLSFRFPEVMRRGPVDRERFIRPADVPEPELIVPDEEPWFVVDSEPGDEVDTFTDRVFAGHERLHIRSRYELHPQTSVA
jgi:hypothetical protein